MLHIPIYMELLSAEGEIEWQRPIGAYEKDVFSIYDPSLIKGDYDWLMLCTTEGQQGDELGDMECSFNQWSDDNTWLFEMKDLDFHLPLSPSEPIGADTICIQDSITYYTIIGQLYGLLYLAYGTSYRWYCHRR